jgi:hypothetical protein
MPIDSGFGGLNVVGSTRLDLNEAQDIAIPRDQVDFPAAARRAEISRDHYIADPPQVKVSVFFSASPGVQMWGSFPGAEQTI